MPINEEIIVAHTAVVHQWITAFNNHDVEAIVSLYAEDAELFDSGMKQSRQGHWEIERWFTKRFRDMPSIRYTRTGLLFAEVQVAVLWTTEGYSPRIAGQSWLSRSFRVNGVSIFTLRDGLIQNQHGYYDHLAVLEQILPALKRLSPRL